MVKAVERTMRIGNIRLVYKSGGKSGEWRVENGEERVENGEWRGENGEGRMERRE
ncbi:MAG: hypothetical protein DRI79_00585 [Chloroflexi bacterium]|nr:MAG: hypothetical protein DRI79_00585 [Chloroflexota bacterium]